MLTFEHCGVCDARLASLPAPLEMSTGKIDVKAVQGAPPKGSNVQPEHPKGNQSEETTTTTATNAAMAYNSQNSDNAPRRNLRAAQAQKVQRNAGADSTAATLWLAASGISVEALLAECHSLERSDGYSSILSTPSTLDLEDFCQGLLKTVDGLTPHQAELFAAEAKCGVNTVSIDLWKGVFREASARVEAAIDLLQQIIGPEELGWLVEQLAALGMFASLQNTQLVALLAQKRSWQGPRWGMVEEMLSLLDPAGTGEVPARPLARLLSKRAEAFWQNQVADATAHVPFPPVPLNANAADGFVAPQLFAARQLISALLCLIRAGELDVNLVAEQLDAAAVQVSDRKPILWCSSSPEPVALAGILETDAEGTSRALEVWQALHLPTSASAAVQALKSLSSVECVEGALPRLRAQNIIQELVHSGFGGLPPQSLQTPGLFGHFFQALLSIGMGPEQLRSRLRTSCGTAGKNKVYLDQFAACLQKSGVVMAWADLLEAWWWDAGLIRAGQS